MMLKYTSVCVCVCAPVRTRVCAWCTCACDQCVHYECVFVVYVDAHAFVLVGYFYKLFQMNTMRILHF